MLERIQQIWMPRSIVTKLMAAFVLVVFPLCAAGFIITSSSSNQMKTEIKRANESKLHFYYSHLEFELNRITSLVTEYSYDETLSSFSTRTPIMTAYEKAYTLNQIHIKLRQMKETSPYISDVVYYVPGIGKKVSATGGVSNVPAKEWQGLLGSMGNLQGALSRYNGELYLLRSNPFNLDRVTPPNFLLGIRLSSEELRVRLQEFAVSGESDIVLAFGSRSDYMISTSESGETLKDFEQIQEGRTPEGSVERLRSSDYYYYSIYDHDNHFRLTASIPNDVVLKPIQIYSQWLILLLVLSLVVVILFSLWTYRMIHRPLARLVRGFRRAEQGDTAVQITDTRKDEFGYLYDRFNEMMKHLHTLIEENYVQRIRTGEAELKHLQSQITPHFLYNSLFSIKQMAELENVELIKEFSDYLGQYFRYMTRDAAQEASLGEELDHALVYLAIQEIRFGTRMRSEIGGIPEDCRSIRVPRVLLQPMIENVFEHGLGQKAGGGLLMLTFIRDEQRLVIRIEDNGEDLTEEQLKLLRAQLASTDGERGEITGMMNVHQRLRFKFGPGSGLQVERSPLGGLCVMVTIPTGEEND
ncbi:sensor histidine kinase [Paenibacillus sambharensis]|nr:histidine kinase [Paenibacillus sambharensis]